MIIETSAKELIMKSATYDEEHYQRSIDRIIQLLEKDTGDKVTLTNVQNKLDKLADKYRDDESMGIKRYKLYQAQAMIRYREGNFPDAINWIVESENVRGERYDFAEEFIGKLNEPQHKKSINRWIVFFFILSLSLVIITILFGYAYRTNQIKNQQQLQNKLQEATQRANNLENERVSKPANTGSSVPSNQPSSSSTYPRQSNVVPKDNTAECNSLHANYLASISGRTPPDSTVVLHAIGTDSYNSVKENYNQQAVAYNAASDALYQQYAANAAAQGCKNTYDSLLMTKATIY